MKKISIIAALVLSGCISIEMPGVVSDMVKAAKDVYKEARADKTEPTRAPAAPARRVLAHSYVGKDNEIEADIKQSCVKEAAQKLNRIAGKEQGYSVLKNEVATLNNYVFANCELAIED